MLLKLWGSNQGVPNIFASMTNVPQSQGLQRLFGLPQIACAHPGFSQLRLAPLRSPATPGRPRPSWPRWPQFRTTAALTVCQIAPTLFTKPPSLRPISEGENGFNFIAF